MYPDIFDDVVITTYRGRETIRVETVRRKNQRERLLNRYR